MPLLDLIVTHYNEPWDTGKKFFDMLNLQRGIDPDDVRIIIVQDGPDGALDWERLLSRYPFTFKVLTIPHGGVSVARNKGLEYSNAQWVMFCDFDDSFSSIHALHKFLSSAGDDVDLVFSHVDGEAGLPETFTLDPYMDNDTFIHGKMIRRELLIRSGVRFEPGVTFSEDTLFCHVLAIVLNPARKREIPERLYARCWSDISVCRNEDNAFLNAVGLFRSRKALCREYYERGCPKNFRGTVVKTVFDYYYATTSRNYPNVPWFEDDFLQFWEAYKDVFMSTDDDLLALEHDISFYEATHKLIVTIPDIAFWDWIKKMEQHDEGGETDEGKDPDSH